MLDGLRLLFGLLRCDDLAGGCSSDSVSSYLRVGLDGLELCLTVSDLFSGAAGLNTLRRAAKGTSSSEDVASDGNFLLEEVFARLTKGSSSSLSSLTGVSLACNNNFNHNYYDYDQYEFTFLF